MTITAPITLVENKISLQSSGGEQGPPGEGVPVGGESGQVLSKIDATDYNTEWANPGEAINGIPAAGTVGQILVKNSITDYDASWVDDTKDIPVGGTANQVLQKIDGNNYNVRWNTVGDMRGSNNLSDLTNQATARKNIGADSAYARLYLSITGKVGSAGTDLDSLTTTGATPQVSVGNLIITRTGPSGSINMWLLRAGTDAEDVQGGIIRPDDYAASTNEVVYEILL